MSENTVILNGNIVSFAADEADAASGETDITPGHFIDLNSNGEANLQSGEATTGRGLMATLPRDAFGRGKSDKYNTDDDGERVHYAHVPVGGEFDGFLAAGGDLTTAANANVTQNDLLVETDNGALANFSSAETSGTPEGALYRAQESVDNSGASAGVDNQVRIEAERIA
jgi:hypothetical protein